MGWSCERCGPLPDRREGSYRSQACPRCGGPLSLERPTDEIRLTCPWCQASVDASAPRCTSCRRWFVTPRCDRCGTRVHPAAASCEQCGATLDVPVVDGARSLPCPACRVDLEVRQVGQVRVPECPSCHGVLIEHQRVRAWVADRGAQAPGDVPDGPPAADGDGVRYRRCPRCNGVMNRVNYGPGSGVIVDACEQHGLWLDAGELARILEFARRGGVERARKFRDMERRAVRSPPRPLLADVPLREQGPRAGSPGRALLEMLVGVFLGR